MNKQLLEEKKSTLRSAASEAERLMTFLELLDLEGATWNDIISALSYEPPTSDYAAAKLHRVFGVPVVDHRPNSDVAFWTGILKERMVDPNSAYVLLDRKARESR
jgi:hypothetical protein